MTACEDKITKWFAGQYRLPANRFPIGIGDDMAQIRIGEESFLVTTDMLLDGVHFDLNKVTLRQAACKAMLVSLSDCAAMATRPLCAVAAVALPRGFGTRELKHIHAGIADAGDRYGCSLVGGDITCWRAQGKFAINITMMSLPGNSAPVRRCGAKAGDSICVTGQLGGSLSGRHMDFIPRLTEAIEMTKLVKINAMIDISDGVSSDLKRICESSSAGAVIEAVKLPLSKYAAKSKDPLSSALNDGEDFELLFTLSNSNCRKLLKNWDHDTAITEIGRITGGKKVMIKQFNGHLRQIKSAGFDHLKG